VVCSDHRASIYVDDVSATVGTPSYQRDQNSFFAKSNLGLNFVPNPTQIPKFTTGLITSNNDNIVVWPDSTPMTGGNANLNDNAINDTFEKVIFSSELRQFITTETLNIQTRTSSHPSVCVSSYYDPTDRSTARNPIGLPDVVAALTPMLMALLTN